MPRTAAKKPTSKATSRAQKATVTKDLQVSMKKAGAVKAGMMSRGPAGTIWWNPIPIQPLKGKTKRSSGRVGAHRKG